MVVVAAAVVVVKLHSETHTIIHPVRIASRVEGVYFAPALRRAIKR